ncbi:hypothetical protein ACFX15_005663 [Malus domestica]
MNPSTLTSQRSSLRSPFLNPISLPAATSVQSRRRPFRVSFSRNSAAPSEQSTDAASSPPADVFGGKRELTGVQPVVEKLTPPLRIVTSAIVFAGAVAAGYGLGLRLGKSQNAAYGGAAVLGAAGGAAVYALNSCAPEVAAVNLHNYVAGLDDPKAVKKEDIEGIARKYGVSKQDEAFNAELCGLYCRFVTSVLPPGAQELKGDEVDTIVSFKNSLGIDDPEAASMHMEIGRRIFRQRLETDREGDLEQRRAFQKLIYVSTLVFGDASSFLLPWKRVFKVTDSQVELAIRDNAQRLYASKLKSVGRDIGAEQLVKLKEAQRIYRLSDEHAEDLFKEHARKLVEANISAALRILKSRTRSATGITEVVEELDKMLELNNLLISLKNHPDAARFAPGLGAVSLHGGDYDADRKMDDLKLLFRAYVTDTLSTGRLEESKHSALNQLRNIFGLGKREAESIVLDVTSKVYRKRLSQSVTSGDLEAADSKAAFLQNICEELHFDPQRASQIHEEIYRQKLQQCVADGELNDDDVAALLRLRVMLCIPQQTIEAAHSDICGSLFEKVVKDAIASGVDGYDADVKQAVRKAAHGLRLSREAAMSIAGKAVRKIFINYVKRARSVGSRTESAKELKKMIAFNTLVVTELVADIKGESSDSATEEPIKEPEPEVLEDEEWESIQTLRKIRPDKELAAKLGKPGQTEITLKDDLEERERTDLYKTYLLFCITGEVKRIPFGAQITTKKDDSEYVLLNQLGAILGLSTTEIVEVHRSLAEQAFRQQAEVILADGQLTKARVEQLNELQKQVGLPPQYVEKIIKNITTTKMAAAIETAIGQGRLNIKQIRELKESSVNLDSMISESLRESLFKKTVDEIFSSGTGEFDEEEVYEKIPADLNINAEKAKNVVRELAQTRLSNSLIQAVSLLRQRNRQGVVSSLNDLLACDKAVPAKPLSWDVPEELADLFAIYMKSGAAPEKLSRLQYLLGISDSMAATLQEMGDRSQTIGAEEEKFVHSTGERKKEKKYIVPSIFLAMAFISRYIRFCFFVLLFLFRISSAQLSSNYYSTTCPRTLSIVRNAVVNAVVKEHRMGASLLRLHFHDCFVNGCDASVLLDDTANFTGEKTAPPNTNSLRGFELIDTIKSQLEGACPGVVSCADILAIAARDSVVSLGGPSWTVQLGRRDSTTASLSAATSELPSPSLNLNDLITSFSTKGFTTKELVALSGSHTTGQARCLVFRERIHNETNIDSSFATSLKSNCTASSGTDDNLSSLDVTSPFIFDNAYFKNLVNSKGLMHSDQQLFSGGSTDSLVKTYSTTAETFYTDFANAMLKMGSLSPLTGKSGQVRTNCRKIN